MEATGYTLGNSVDWLLIGSQRLLKQSDLRLVSQRIAPPSDSFASTTDVWEGATLYIVLFEDANSKHSLPPKQNSPRIGRVVYRRQVSYPPGFDPETHTRMVILNRR